MSNLSRQSTVADLIGEYEIKHAAIDDEVKAFEQAFTRLEMSACVQGKFVASVAQRPYVHAEALRRNLCKSGWKAIYDRLQIDRIASANDRRLFDRAIENPPELTMDNARATFGDYLERPRYHILRGLAETFADLDPAYKSHSKVKIGVKGLPKRVILSGFGQYSFGSYGRDKLRDIINALAAYRGEPLMEHAEFNAMDRAFRLGEDAVFDGRTYQAQERYGKAEEYQTRDRGISIRSFANGNGHIIFTPATLLDINRALAEFYGEVLPDIDPEAPEKAPSTAVAKDLQFYWSPEAVVAAACEAASVWNLKEWRNSPPAPLRILEPSCGDGRILDELRRRGHRSLGIEYHAGRAATARAKGHDVLTANFLECPPKPEFDRVVMNPPFYGRHYAKHVQHARRFLKPDGILVSILPATAHYDHDELKGEWRDLPVGSFAEAGTNVPTGLLKMRAS